MTATVDPSFCPRCGGPNACVMASGDSVEPCWCTRVVVPAALLEGLPGDKRGAACLCIACITESAMGNVAGKAPPASRGQGR